MTVKAIATTERESEQRVWHARLYTKGQINFQTNHLDGSSHINRRLCMPYLISFLLNASYGIREGEIVTKGGREWEESVKGKTATHTRKWRAKQPENERAGRIREGLDKEMGHRKGKNGGESCEFRAGRK
jgi:hypothetical protein